VVEEFAAWTLERGDWEAALAVVVDGGGEAAAMEEVGVWLLDFRLLPPRKLRRDMLLERRTKKKSKRGR
jgi:hypothetical protein